MGPEIGWAFGGLDAAIHHSSLLDYTGLNLLGDSFSLGQASSLFSLAARPDGGATVMGWREARFDSAAAASEDQEPLTDLRWASGPGDIPIDLDAAALFGEEIIIFDFDQLHVAPARQNGALEQGAPEQAMLLAPMGDAPEQILDTSLEAIWTDRFHPNAGVDNGLGLINPGMVFENSSPLAAAVTEFVGFDTSLPTPIMASIEWGG